MPATFIGIVQYPIRPHKPLDFDFDAWVKAQPTTA
jgi:hypothetical protein